jgi:hypothetical protein
VCYNTNTTHTLHTTLFWGDSLSRNYPTWTARIPPEVKEYLQEIKGLSAGHCLCEYYRILKENQLPEKQKLLEKHRKIVTQLEQDVLQLEQKNTEKNDKKIENVKNQVINSFNPEFFIGQELDGIKITKKLLEEWNK